jgi:hypothetical protein
MPDLEDLFADIDIPFNCEFLVAYAEGDLVTLTEVYRMRSDHPLQTYRFGNWTSHGGLTWPSVSFSQRRNNLQGIKLKVGHLEVRFSYAVLTKGLFSLFSAPTGKHCQLTEMQTVNIVFRRPSKIYVASVVTCLVSVGEKKCFNA